MQWACESLSSVPFLWIPFLLLTETSEGGWEQWDFNRVRSRQYRLLHSGRRYHAPRWECLLKKRGLHFTSQNFLKLSAVVVCHCLLLVSGNKLYVGAKRTARCSVKNHQPEFRQMLLPTSLLHLAVFLTATRGYFGPPPFHNVNIVFDV